MSERIDEIRTKLRSACYEFIANGGKIVAGQTRSAYGMKCCPLAAVAGQSTSSPLEAGRNRFAISEDEMGWFLAGYDNVHISYATDDPPNVEFYQLGVELRKEFIK